MRFNIRSLLILAKRSTDPLRLVEVDLSGIYYVLCEYGKVYVGQTGYIIKMRRKEHDSFSQTSQWWLNTVLNRHTIKFKDTTFLARTTRCRDHLVKGVIIVR
jgi:hypothetical protein